jgi:hypothetical protein
MVSFPWGEVRIKTRNENIFLKRILVICIQCISYISITITTSTSTTTATFGCGGDIFLNYIIIVVVPP